MTAVLELNAVSKRYGATTTLQDVSFSCFPGEVHALIGENGAGKSTLVKVLSGMIRPDVGQIRLEGIETRFDSPSAALTVGIATAFQELTLVPQLSVSANLLLAREPNICGLVRPRQSTEGAQQILEDWEAGDIDPEVPVSSLPLSTRQRLETIRALSRQGKVLLLDEPTSALGAEGVEWFFTQVQKAQVAGAAVVFISHRIEEIKRIATRVSVLRNGRIVETRSMGGWDHDALLIAMGSRPPDGDPDTTTIREKSLGDLALEVKNLRNATDLHGVDLSVRRGEIVGVSALEGHGQRTLFMSLFGLKPWTGTVLIAGKQRKLRSPREAVRQGIGISFIPEDRQAEGILGGLSVLANASLPSLRRFSRMGFICSKNERRVVEKTLASLNIDAATLDLDVADLSGGNQQKIIMAKWMLRDADIMLLYDPTRGIDVMTKADIYEIIRSWSERGKAVLFYSTDIEEILELCDRAVVMHRGAIRANLRGDQLTEQNILQGMFDTAPGQAVKG